MPRATLGTAAALLLLCCPAMPARALGHHAWSRISTVGEAGLAATALGVPLVRSDWSGLADAGESLFVGGGTAYGLKQIVHERRPDGRGDDSFPSAHSAISFAAATTLERRYGWQAGIPAFIGASVVGVARIEAKRHFWYDVVAGAALGSASGLLLTSPENARVRLVPWGGPSGGGLAASVRF